MHERIGLKSVAWALVALLSLPPHLDAGRGGGGRGGGGGARGGGSRGGGGGARGGGSRGGSGGARGGGSRGGSGGARGGGSRGAFSIPRSSARPGSSRGGVRQPVRGNNRTLQGGKGRTTGKGQPDRRSGKARSAASGKSVRNAKGVGLANANKSNAAQFRSLAQSKNPADRALGTAGAQGRPLNASQRDHLNQSIDRLQGRGTLGPAEQARLNSLRALRWQDRGFNHIHVTNRHFDNYFNGLGWGWWGYRPWWGGWGPGAVVLADASSFDWSGPRYSYPGIIPYFPAYEFPAGENIPGATVVQILPGPAPNFPPVPNEEGPPTKFKEPGLKNYSTRFLRIGNAAREKVTFHIRYHTFSAGGAAGWFPEQKKTLDLTLEPGAVIDVYDAGWRLNADRVKLWAEAASGQKWDNYKNAEFRLVPEEDEDGQPRYRAAACDTVVFTVSPKALSAEKLKADKETPAGK